MLKNILNVLKGWLLILNKYKRLLGNSAIFAVGSIGIKVVQLILVPMYTYCLTTSQFGKVDFINNLVSILAPIVYVGITQSVFRFALDEEIDKQKVFSTGIIFFAGVSMIIAILGIFLERLSIDYIWYISLLLIFTTLNGMTLDYIRAIGYIREYAIAGIVYASSMGVANVILLTCLHLKIQGYLNAILIGQLVSMGYVFIVTPAIRHIHIHKFRYKLLKDMCIYSLPLIPNIFSWWINSASDRFFILLMLGSSSAGVYAIINKFPTVIVSVMEVFSRSWQMSAVEEYGSKDDKVFISNVFEYMISILFVCSVMLLSVIKPAVKILLSPAYYKGWMLVPYMLLAINYSSVANFLGSLYTASKKTKEVLYSTFLGAIINVVFTIILIKVIGIYGAIVANIMSFLVIDIYRYIQMYNLNKIKINYIKLLMLNGLFIVASLSTLLIKNYIETFAICIVCIIFQVLFDNDLFRSLKNIYTVTKRRIKRD